MRAALLLLLLLLPILPVQAQSSAGMQTIRSVANGSWDDPNSWDAGVPGAADDVIISAGTTISSNGNEVNNLTVEAGGALRHNYGSRTVVVKGDLVNHGEISGRDTATSYGLFIDVAGDFRAASAIFAPTIVRVTSLRSWWKKRFVRNTSTSVRTDDTWYRRTRTARCDSGRW